MGKVRQGHRTAVVHARVLPTTLEQLRLLAEKDRRTVTRMIEVLIQKAAEQQGIAA